jgi:hypothetical protein
MPSNRDQVLLKAFEDLRTNLLDLTPRNPLISFKPEKSARAVNVIDELPDQVWGTLVDEERTMALIPVKEAEAGSTPTELPLGQPKPDGGLPSPNHTDTKLQTPFDQEKYDSRMRNMFKIYNSFIEETGINTAFLAIGFLNWRESSDSEVERFAPLILIPVTIEKKIKGRGGHYQYSITYTGDEIESNRCLAEFLKKDKGVELPEIYDEENETYIAPEKYFALVQDAVSEFPRWKVDRRMSLSFFSFAKLRMFHDLDTEEWSEQLQKSILQNEVLSSVVCGPETEREGEAASDETHHLPDEVQETNLIYDADSSQLAAINEAMKGRSLVIEGPPGTGKSQTIANLIACALSHGKRVLFVAEKKAALDVVAKKLDERGLSAFCFDLHSHNIKKAAVYSSIKKRIGMKRSGNVPTSADGETKKHRQRLQEYVTLLQTRVHPEHPTTIHDAFTRYLELRTKVSGRILVFPANELERFSPSYSDNRETLAAFSTFLTDNHPLRELPWYGLKPRNDSPAEIKIENALRQVTEACQGVAIALNDLEQAGLSLPGDTVSKIEKWLQAMPDVAIKLWTSANQSVLRALWKKRSDIPTFQKFCEVLTDIWSLQEQTGRYCPRLKMEQDEIQKFHGLLTSLLERGFSNHRLIEFKGTLGVLKSLAQRLGQFGECRNSISGISDSSDDRKAVLKLQKLADSLRVPHQLSEKDIAAGLFDGSAMGLVAQLQKEHHELASWKERLSALFNLKDAPDATQVRTLRQTFLQKGSSYFAFINKDVVRGKKELRLFYRKANKAKNEERCKDLEDLENFLEKHHDFEHSAEAHKIFGTLFKGVNTDWSTVELAVAWGEKVRSHVESPVFYQWVTERASEGKLFSTADQICALCEATLKDLTTCEGLLHKTAWRYKEEKVSLAHLGQSLTDLIAGLDAELGALDKLEVSDSENVRDLLMLSTKLLNFTTLCDQLNTIKGDLEQKLSLQLDLSAVGCEAIMGTKDWLENTEIWNNTGNEFKESLEGDQIDERLRQWHSSHTKVSDLMLALKNALGDLSKVAELDANQFFGATTEQVSLEVILSQCEDCLSKLSALPTWFRYCSQAKDFEKWGCKELLHDVEQGKLHPSTLLDHYDLGVYYTLCRHIAYKQPKLQGFDCRRHEHIREQFKKLDKANQETFATNLAHSLLLVKPAPGVSHGRKKELTQMGLIKNEATKQRAHIPIRELVKRSGKALLDLKPCFMMSPLAAATFLPLGSVKFDLILMDEASQLRPADGIGSVMRGSQLVVVGDSNQMPPSDFFQKRLADGEDDSDENGVGAEQKESVLELASRAFYPSVTLTWHYRSKDPKLIEFSNSRYYDEKLLLFPAAQKSSDTGVHLVRVGHGLYSERKNVAEAERVVDEIIRVGSDPRGLSLGVVAMNAVQEELIEELWDKRVETDPLAKIARDRLMSDEIAERLFIKNLENVQGDERDVILISTTYGPAQPGEPVAARFGPLSRELGWRRFNVLITRARHRLVVVTSLKPSDIKVTDSKSRAIGDFRDYLEYAESGKLPNQSEITLREPGYFEKAVGTIVRQFGYDIEYEVGTAGYFIDIGVRHPRDPSKFLMGIECDGKWYHSGRAVRDRDRLRQEILENRGWKLHRIWSTDWFHNFDDARDKLKSVLESHAKLC